ncbi:hypothetical protein BGZ94_008579 [Podila epigama]|nr:hypothetical protein BGZ94_008579 [Podila epigama]
MKFGTQLKTSRVQHWKFHFVHYDGLKALLKDPSHGCEFTEKDEAQFEKMLLAELDKVASFQTLKLGEVQRRTEHCEYTIQQHQQPSAKSTEKLTLASFVATESEINKITKDLQDLARFQRLNYTAFLKIIKKHDKHTSGYTSLRSIFMTALQAKPFHKESFAPLMSRLSTLYCIVRTGSATTATKARSIDSSDEDEYLDHPNQVSDKIAFWVHPDNVMDLKMLILKYLPFIVYEPAPSHTSTLHPVPQQSQTLTCESPVSTIYLDNQDFDLYMAQVEQQDKTEAVRLRWYGSDQKYMWVEHQQVQTSTPSSSSSSTSVSPNAPTATKHRFQMKSKQVPQLLQGSANLQKSFDQLRQAGQRSNIDLQQFEERTRIVQSRIKKRGLKPVVQTFFNRTTFQVPGDARVRITLDTDVVMVRERTPGMFSSFSSPNMSDVSPISSPTTLSSSVPFPQGRWTPSAILQAENYPFPHMRDQDIVCFPYAVLKIRTLTEPQEDIPSWIENISQSHLVEMVPNFAKDQHAIASLYESRVSLLPFWLSDMDRDIRKQAAPSGFPRRVTSFTSQESNGSIASSASHDSFISAESSPATSIAETASHEPILSTMKENDKSREKGKGTDKGKDKGQDKEMNKLEMKNHLKTIEPSELDLPDIANDLTVTVQRMETQQIQGPPSMESLKQGNHPSNYKSSKPKSKRPVISCLKKPVSYSSFQSRSGNSSSHTDGEPSSPTTSSGSGGSRSSRRSQKRVTFNPTTQQHFWDKAQHWLPFAHGANEGANAQHHLSEDLEAQYGAPGTTRRPARTRLHHGRVHEGPFTLSSISMFGRRMTWMKLFWMCLSGLNVGLLFVGLVLALMNLGDGVGTEAASVFLIVSCLCMGSTVWAHLSRMDGVDDDADDEEDDEVNADLRKIKAQTANSERVGLLSGATPSSYSSLSLPSSHLDKTKGTKTGAMHNAASKGRWVRRRVMPVVTFVCLVTAVTFNAMARS